jgi:hypothetical protein
VIANFVRYAEERLGKSGTRVSTAVFGLSASRDLGIGQVPRYISRHVDSISPMSYPVLYGDGELGLASPSTEPGETVFRTLTDFRRQLKGSRAQLVPWVQDWGYAPSQVLAQIDALLAEAGTDKSHLLSATIFLPDIADFAEMNVIWEKWVAPGATPARATVEAALAGPEYMVEIQVVAALPEKA